MHEFTSSRVDDGSLDQEPPTVDSASRWRVSCHLICCLLLECNFEIFQGGNNMSLGELTSEHPSLKG